MSPPASHLLCQPVALKFIFSNVMLPSCGQNAATSTDLTTLTSNCRFSLIVDVYISDTWQRTQTGMSSCKKDNCELFYLMRTMVKVMKQKFCYGKENREIKQTNYSRLQTAISVNSVVYHTSVPHFYVSLVWLLCSCNIWLTCNCKLICINMHTNEILLLLVCISSSSFNAT